MAGHRRTQVTPGRARLISAGRVVIATLAIGCAAAAAAVAGAPPAAAGAVAPARCPAVAPAPAAGAPLGAGPVLSGSVAAIRLCRYGALPAQRLRGHLLTRSHPLIAGLYTALNALPPVRPGPTSCPVDLGSEVVLLVRYRSGGTATVTVGLSGCGIVTRGHVARSAALSPGGAALLAHLERLTP